MVTATTSFATASPRRLILQARSYINRERERNFKSKIKAALEMSEKPAQLFPIYLVTVLNIVVVKFIVLKIDAK